MGAHTQNCIDSSIFDETGRSRSNNFQAGQGEACPTLILSGRVESVHEEKSGPGVTPGYLFSQMELWSLSPTFIKSPP